MRVPRSDSGFVEAEDHVAQKSFFTRLSELAGCLFEGDHFPSVGPVLNTSPQKIVSGERVSSNIQLLRQCQPGNRSQLAIFAYSRRQIDSAITPADGFIASEICHF